MPRTIEVIDRTNEKPLPFAFRKIIRIVLSVLLGYGLYQGITTPLPSLCLPTDLELSLQHQRLQAFAANQGAYTQAEIEEMGYDGLYTCHHSLMNAFEQRVHGLLGKK